MTLWNDNLLIGVKDIDEQHKNLIKAIDELMDASFHGKGKDAIEKTLKFVESYTKRHFADEEAVHQKNGYPQAHAHKQMHQGFIPVLNGLVSDFNREGPTSGLSIKLSKTLVDWLTKHITVEDRKYAAFINAKR